MTTATVESLIDLLNAKGGSAYFGEPVSILEHSLQAAHSAELAAAGPAAISAALLHDIGHMLHGLDEEIAHRGLDGMHEEVAAKYLSRWFGDEVTVPILLHVPAKRFLCWQDPAYLQQLSPSSLESLALQGGPMNDEQAADFCATRSPTPPSRCAVGTTRPKYLVCAFPTRPTIFLCSRLHQDPTRAARPSTNASLRFHRTPRQAG